MVRRVGKGAGGGLVFDSRHPRDVSGEGEGRHSVGAASSFAPLRFAPLRAERNCPVVARVDEAAVAMA